MCTGLQCQNKGPLEKQCKTHLIDKIKELGTLLHVKSIDCPIVEFLGL